MEVKTSEQWQELCKIEVLDPDVWDRMNFENSWCLEKISKEEFEERLIVSTCRFPSGTISAQGKLTDIWTDK